MNQESHLGTILRNSVKPFVKVATHESMEKSVLMRDGHCMPKKTWVGFMENANVVARY